MWICYGLIMEKYKKHDIELWLCYDYALICLGSLECDLLGMYMLLLKKGANALES